MKRKVIKIKSKLKASESQSVKLFSEKMVAGKTMMDLGAQQYNEFKKKLWEEIYDLFPEVSDELVQDAIFNSDRMEITYSVPLPIDLEIERKKHLKEQAIKDMEFEVAAKFRDEERKLKEKKIKMFKGKPE